jgi:DNA modification methylase
MNTVGKSSERKGFVDSGSKSRFFDIDVWGEKNGIIQIPKASQNERNAGCENIEPKTEQNNNPTKRNHHPTVKPVHLMAWLIRLVTKPGDTVLDPFAGSGTTAVACIKQNRNFIMIERQPEYIQIINSRIQYHIKQSNSQNPTLFDKTETE